MSSKRRVGRERRCVLEALGFGREHEHRVYLLLSRLSSEERELGGKDDLATRPTPRAYRYAVGQQMSCTALSPVLAGFPQKSSVPSSLEQASLARCPAAQCWVFRLYVSARWTAALDLRASAHCVPSPSSKVDRGVLQAGSRPPRIAFLEETPLSLLPELSTIVSHTPCILPALSTYHPLHEPDCIHPSCPFMTALSFLPSRSQSTSLRSSSSIPRRLTHSRSSTPILYQRTLSLFCLPTFHFFRDRTIPAHLPLSLLPFWPSPTPTRAQSSLSPTIRVVPAAASHATRVHAPSIPSTSSTTGAGSTRSSFAGYASRGSAMVETKPLLFRASLDALRHPRTASKPLFRFSESEGRTTAETSDVHLPCLYTLSYHRPDPRRSRTPSS
uniref:Uncharacterized protein n=1 Tax=Mycena chlorophos TaxID=658473 RepID=A0ABQ0L2W6_MYCCL|nr:predicted protein [Mycena chlorophos]